MSQRVRDGSGDWTCLVSLTPSLVPGTVLSNPHFTVLISQLLHEGLLLFYPFYR